MSRPFRSMFWMMSALILAAYGISVLLSHVISSSIPSATDNNIAAPGWETRSWPFLKDQFPSGLSFECLGDGCRGAIQVTVRIKIGFCNCITGVSDDEELERVADVELFLAQMHALGDGRKIEFGGLEGRMRAYLSEDKETVLLSIAYNNRCDVVVATATGSSRSIEENVTQLLSSDPIRGWIERRLNL